MKKILIVNNNMKVGGVQRSLCSLLKNIADRYEVTLLLFEKCGAYLGEIPESVNVITVHSAWRYLGISRGECVRLREKLARGMLAGTARLFGRPSAIRLINLTQPVMSEHYDVAISYLHNGRLQSFYGGVNEFVLEKVFADRKIAFLHCDYGHCGGNHSKNNRLYEQFDRIAACSEGCRDAFLKVMPELADRCFVVRNSFDGDEIQRLADSDTIRYTEDIHAVFVGRLAHEKAADRAIRAAAYVNSHGLRLTLHLVGDGGERAALETMVREQGLQDTVIFEGEQTNPYRYMKNADLLILTSYHEAAPIVIDEAGVLGLPVLTVRTTSSEEMVTRRGAGWVCENEQEALNHRLLEILEDPRKLRQKQQELRKQAEAFSKEENAAAGRQFEELLYKI